MRQINRYKLIIYGWVIIVAILVLGGFTPEINAMIIVLSLVASMFADSAIYMDENAKESRFRNKMYHIFYGI